MGKICTESLSYDKLAYYIFLYDWNNWTILPLDICPFDISLCFHLQGMLFSGSTSMAFKTKFQVAQNFFSSGVFRFMGPQSMLDILIFTKQDFVISNKKTIRSFMLFSFLHSLLWMTGFSSGKICLSLPLDYISHHEDPLFHYHSQMKPKLMTGCSKCYNYFSQTKSEVLFIKRCQSSFLLSVTLHKTNKKDFRQYFS